MAIKTQFRLKGKNRDSYLELIQEFPLASIKSERHLKEGQEVMDSLLARGKLDEGEETYLDALSDLVAAYEDAHHAIDGNGQSVAHHIATEAGMERNREPGDKAERASELYRLYRGDRSAGDQTEPCSGESGQ